MATRSRSPHDRTGESAARSILLRLPGWAAVRQSRALLRMDGRAYRLVPLAAGTERVALLCEAPLGEPLPDPATRRALRRRIDGRHPRHLTVFTDAAHSAWIWSWIAEPPGGPRAYLEWSADPAESPAALARRLGGLRGEDGARGAALARGLDDHPLVPVLLGVVAGRGRGAPADPRQQVQDAIEQTSSPDALRAVWRALLRLRVFDPACGTGVWLLSALRVLEPAYAACLERMRIWVLEQDRQRGHRRDRLRDFRALLERADADPRFVRELIVLHNLFGVDRSEPAVAKCRRRLRGALGASATGAEEDALRIRAGDLRLGFREPREVEDALAGCAPDGLSIARLLEDADAAERAADLLRDMHLRTGSGIRELAAGFRAVRGRLDALNARLDALRARMEGIGPDAAALAAWRAEHRPLHPLVEHRGALRRGGFSLVRPVAP